MADVVVAWSPAHPDGDESERIDVLYRTYARRLRALCGRRLGTPDDADDAVHETILKAARAWPSLRPGADPWPWLGTIATHVCCDLQRARTRHEGAGFADRIVDVEDAVVSGMRSELVQGALARLSEPMRSTLMLRELEGWSYDEIAALQGRSLAAVRSTIMRGRRTIKESLGQLVAAGRLPLPAAVPVLWRRAKAGASRRSASVMAIDPSTAFGLAAPARAALFVSVLAIGASGAFVAGASSGRSGPNTSRLTTEPPIGALVVIAATVVEGPGAGATKVLSPSSAVAGPSASVMPTSPRGPVAAVAIAPPPTDRAPEVAASAELSGPSDEATLDGKIAGRAPGVGDFYGRNRLSIDCDYSEARQRLCEGVDAVPPTPTP